MKGERAGGLVHRPAYESLAAELARIAEADPGREVCGFVTAGPGGELRVEPTRNDADGPNAFRVHPEDQLRIVRRLRAEGGRIAAVFHSHVDGPAWPSATDREQSLLDGAPVLPGADWIVIGTRIGKVREIRIFSCSGNGFSELGCLPPG